MMGSYWVFSSVEGSTIIFPFRWTLRDWRYRGSTEVCIRSAKLYLLCMFSTLCRWVDLRSTIVLHLWLRAGETRWSNERYLTSFCRFCQMTSIRFLGRSRFSRWNTWRVHSERVLPWGEWSRWDCWCLNLWCAAWRQKYTIYIYPK